MVHWIKMLAEKSDDLSSIFRIYIVEGENRFLEIVLWPPCSQDSICIPTAPPLPKAHVSALWPHLYPIFSRVSPQNGIPSVCLSRGKQVFPESLINPKQGNGQETQRELPHTHSHTYHFSNKWAQSPTEQAIEVLLELCVWLSVSQTYLENLS